MTTSIAFLRSGRASGLMEICVVEVGLFLASFGALLPFLLAGDCDGVGLGSSGSLFPSGIQGFIKAKANAPHTFTNITVSLKS